MATDDKLKGMSVSDTFSLPKPSLVGFGSKEITTLVSLHGPSVKQQ
jgi:hypothetical protein